MWRPDWLTYEQYPQDYNREGRWVAFPNTPQGDSLIIQSGHPMIGNQFCVAANISQVTGLLIPTLEGKIGELQPGYTLFVAVLERGHNTLDPSLLPAVDYLGTPIDNVGLIAALKANLGFETVNNLTVQPTTIG
jgi:hypothetical protein